MDKIVVMFGCCMGSGKNSSDNNRINRRITRIKALIPVSRFVSHKHIVAMSEDTLGDSINRIISEKNQKYSLNNGHENNNNSTSIHSGAGRYYARRRMPSRRYMRLLSKKIVAKLTSLRMLRLLVVFVFLLVLILKNKTALYYKTLDIIDPIVVTKSYKLFNNGIDNCISEQMLQNQKIDEGAASAQQQNEYSKYKFYKQKLLNMDPSYEIVTYYNLHHNGAVNNTMSKNTNNDNKDSTQNQHQKYLLSAVLDNGQSTVKNFKRILAKLSELSLDKSETTLAFMLKGIDKDDNDIESFVDNYYKINYENKINFSKIVLIYYFNEFKPLVNGNKQITTTQPIEEFSQETKIANFKNFLINNALNKEKHILYISNWKTFDYKSLNKVQEETLKSNNMAKTITVGTKLANADDHYFSKKGSKKNINFIVIPAVIFKQGIQFNNILLNGNSWSGGKIIKEHYQEVENLCYQAHAIGYQCVYIEDK